MDAVLENGRSDKFTTARPIVLDCDDSAIDVRVRAASTFYGLPTLEGAASRNRTAVAMRPE